jgi:hypothetical protein
MMANVAAALFSAGGLVLIGIGAFFIFLRPPLLPEDLRFLDQSNNEIEEKLPRLGAWLRHVFMVLGGHAVAAGGLTIFVAATAVGEMGIAAIVALDVTGAASIGLMAIVNFRIHSKFRWMLLTAAGLWVAATAVGLLSKISR